jgi:DNA-binding PadR family transcriptional regulator
MYNTPPPRHACGAPARRLCEKGGMLLSITFDLIRGHTDAIILSYLGREDSYGYQINKDILKATAGRFELKEATLYTAFRRLEQMGLIRSYWGDEKVGARRRYYSITDAGRQAGRDYKREWEYSKDILDELIR